MPNARGDAERELAGAEEIERAEIDVEGLDVQLGPEELLNAWQSSSNL